MYWGQKGEYMVMGVKNQYEKMRKSNINNNTVYESKC